MKSLARTLVLAVVVALSIPLLASAAATTSRVDIDSYMFNSCTNELINVSGFIQTVEQAAVLPDGRIKYVMNTTEHYFGVGQTSGDTYRFNGAQNYVYNFAPDFDGEQTILTQHRLVGMGSVFDLTRHATYHITIVDGNVVASVENFWFTCG